MLMTHTCPILRTFNLIHCIIVISSFILRLSGSMTDPGLHINYPTFSLLNLPKSSSLYGTDRFPPAIVRWRERSPLRAPGRSHPLSIHSSGWYSPVSVASFWCRCTFVCTWCSWRWCHGQERPSCRHAAVAGRGRWGQSAGSLALCGGWEEGRAVSGPHSWMSVAPMTATHQAY